MTGIARTMRTDLTFAWAAKFCFHIVLLFVGLILAYQLRRAMPVAWWMSAPDAIRVLQWAALYAAIGAGVELVFQSERSAWRFVSMREVLGLVRNVSVTTGVFLGVIFFIDRGVQLPRSVLPLTWLVSLALLVGFRMAWRVPHDPGLASHFVPNWWPKSGSDSRIPMLIVGQMVAVDRQLRLIQGDPNSAYQPVGVITPLFEEVGLRLHGVPFISHLSALTRAGSGLPALGGPSHAIVFLADPVRVFGFTTERIGELRRAGHILLKPQSLAEIDGAASGAIVLKEIPLEEFLPRKPISLDSGPVEGLIEGRRVLVTGAGGSIGSEICRQLLALGCSHLSLVDHSEFQLFEIDRELASVAGPATRRAILANVRDMDRVAEVVRSEKPDIIFHAAALKHVALVENNPAEGVLTNVLGTWNVIRAAVTNDVAQFVLISTDKAVAPTNVMGATKRIAESLLDLIPNANTRMTAVRFGNVLGSAGSVVPIFRDQIARGVPITVTHPDVNRFFMTIPEAVQLVLHSTAISARMGGHLPRKFLLEMGEPVKIVDLARQMIELCGKTPDVDILIEFTGLKPGEKLSEVLSDEGEEVLPCVEGIMELLWCRDGTAGQLADIETLVQQSRLANDLPAGRVLEMAERVRAVQGKPTKVVKSRTT
jgi:O-antigen biosynthesis protein WbqV